MAVRLSSDVCDQVSEVPSDSDSDSTSSDYQEIITSSESETFDTSDEEDADMLELVLESAFTSSPAKFGTGDPSARSSLLLLDKSLADDEAVKGRGAFLIVRLCECVCACVCGHMWLGLRLASNPQICPQALVGESWDCRNHFMFCGRF